MVTLGNAPPLDKRLLDDHNSSSSPSLSTPKYKIRKVSALRHFPPFCGPNAPPPLDHPDALSPDPIKPPTHESFDDLVDNAVALATNGFINHVDQLKIDVQPLGNDSMETNGPEAQPIIHHEVEGLAVIDRVVAQEEEEEEEDSVASVVSVDTLKAWLLPDSDSSSLVSHTINFNQRNSPTPKDKFRTRRVSAIRDFPPLCGPNAPVGVSLVQLPNIDMGNATSFKSKIEVSPLSDPVIAAGEELEATLHSIEFEKNESEPDVTLASKNGDEVLGREIVVFSQENSVESSPSETDLGREVVHGLMAESYCPWRQAKLASSSSVGRSSEGKVKKKDSVGWRQRSKVVARKSIPKANSSKRASSTKRDMSVDDRPGDMIINYEGGCDALNAEPLDSFPCPSAPVLGRRDFDVSLPPFGPNTSSLGDARNRVRETLRLFQAICRKLLQGEEAKSGPEVGGTPRQSTEKCGKRIDLQAAKIIKYKGKEINTGANQMGAVPGVEVGDEFQYRVELAIVGVHRLYQGGIDYLKRDGTLLVTSIVASGAYADDMENADVLVYSGQGGNVVGKNKQPEDQKLERGNLALKNSISERNPVRVIRGSKEMKASSDSSDANAKDKIVTTYVYDGLYFVDRYWTETGPHGKMVFKFELKRIPGQAEVAWKEVKGSKKSKQRDGVCVDDISGGKEPFPVCAVNVISSEKPPPFTYITKMMYPDWFRPIPPKGCDCNGRCADSRKCSCAVKNGGEIPYNYNGAIVEAKPLVYECGPCCKCPPSCYNRVSQRGTKLKIEIFKTESRGWGVRSLSFIPSGSFICEYAGELLEDKEAEQRTGNDEYLFDIGRNNVVDVVGSNEDGGYTIDAVQYGNIGRFINHSCTPNLYAQNVLYDHEDSRMPHIMLFAAENIPALQELTYHYNYSVDQVRDSNGNIKKKSCFCGSAECTGRLY